MIKRVSEDTMQIVYKALTSEPQTPNEIAKIIKLNQKTVQMALFQIMSENDDVKMKKVGRFRIFWKISKKKEEGRK